MLTLQEIEARAKAAAAEAHKETAKIKDAAKAEDAQKEIFAGYMKDAAHNSVEGKKVVGEWLKALANGDSAKMFEIVKANSFAGATMKDLSDSVDANGGYLTPLQFSGMLIEKKYKLPVIRALATVMPMSSDKMEVPVESTTPTTNWTAELATITQSDPTFSEIVLSANMLIGISRMSRQILIDSAIQYTLVDWITERFAKAIGRVEDAAFMVGTGSGQAKGIRQYTFSQTATQAGAYLSGDDVINTFYNLPIQYRANAVWLINDKIAKGIRKLKDSSGRYLWSNNFESGGLYQGAIFPTLLDRPVLIQNDIPTNLGAGTNASEIYFGDLSYYVIGQREDVFMEVSTQEGTSFAQHRAAVKVGERLDGQLSTTDAFSQLTAAIPA